MCGYGGGMYTVDIDLAIYILSMYLAVMPYIYIYTLCIYKTNALVFIVGNNNTKNQEENLPQSL